MGGCGSGRAPSFYSIIDGRPEQRQLRAMFYPKMRHDFPQFTLQGEAGTISHRFAINNYC
jgi:hypothetical protein